MSIQVILTEKEVLDTPNYYELGRIATNRYWQEKRNQEGPQFDDEHFPLSINEDGTVRSINRPWRCSICGESTEEIEYDYW